MRARAVFAAFAVATAAVACGRGESSTAATSHLVERAHVTMGSEVRLTAWTADERTALAAFDSVFAEFDRLDQLLSVWKDGSEVLRLNAAAGRAPVTVGSDTMAVLQAAIEAGDATDGKFDVTFGALADIWRFDHDQDGRVPTAAEIRARLSFVDYRQIMLDPGARTAFLARRGMRVHLGGIGKGYAVDRGAAILRDRGVRDFLVQAGGDLYAAGQRGDRPWRVAIRDPRGRGDDDAFATLELRDATFSTSGDYERAFVANGRRYHHILDPDAGEPARGSRSVTIVADRSLLADALSTGIFVLGPDRGMALVERLPGVEAVIVTSENQVLVSSGLRGRLTLLAEPTDGL